MKISIKKGLDYPAFAVWGTKRGKQVFFFDNFEEKATLDAVDELFIDLRNIASVNKKHFYSLEKKGDTCVFSIYINVDDWLERSGYYAVSLFMHSSQEMKNASILDTLHHFLNIYSENIIKSVSVNKEEEKNKIESTPKNIFIINPNVNEEVNKRLFQEEFGNDKYYLLPNLDTQNYTGKEKACFNYIDKSEVDSFFKNRNHNDIEQYQLIYFFPKEEAIATPLTSINQIPAFKTTEKPKTDYTAKQDAFLNPNSDTNVAETEEYQPSIKEENHQYTKIEEEKDITKEKKPNKPKQDKNKTDTNAKKSTQKETTEKTFVDKAKENISIILLAVLIPVTLIAIGLSVWHFDLFATEGKDNKATTENKQDFSIAQLDNFRAEIDEIAKPILEPNWKWSKSEYEQVIKLITEKESLLPTAAIDEIGKENSRTAQNHSKKINSTLIATYNVVVIKRANDLIASTDFDFKIAKELESEIDAFKINYPNSETLKKYKAVSFRIYQAKELIKQKTLPTGDNAIKDDKGVPIKDFKLAAAEIDRVIITILAGDYNFLEPKQRCHLIEWSNILKAREHKDNIEDIVEWIINKNPLDTKRAKEIRAFVANGECTK